jgi:hypothetical protein
MCDYSLMGVPNRLARQDEELVVYKFPTKTKGLASHADANFPESTSAEPSFWEVLKDLFRVQQLVDCVTAVCIPPGARLVLRNIPLALQRSLNIGSTEEVVFTQLTAQADVHRDAILFGNGREILLQRLAEGQRVKILSLDSDREPTLPRRDDMTLHSG